MQDPLLPHIHSPADLRALNEKNYVQLAQEMRTVMIETIARNGGHLASNLGVVELAIALHLCFESPKDSIVWDVGHQCYSHKLLTDRYDNFGTIRQSHGLSGFPSPAESEHDPFYTGHASTSVSTALGLAEAKRLLGNTHFSVAVLGDGALTGGLAYEGLNNAGQSSARLVVVLNDNEMSISRNVGALSRYLSLIRSRPEYRRTKRYVEYFLRKIPIIGNGLAEFASRLKHFGKRLLTNTTIFEDMGLDYIGPVDGHNIGQLCAALESAKLTPRPALVHVRTVKGKGFGSAEAAPERYHGIASDDQGQSEPQMGKTYTDVFANVLCEIAAKDSRVCAVTAAMSMGTGLACFQKRFPLRFFDVGIAEGHAISFAAGLAKQGLRPVVAIYSTFLQRAYDQLQHDAALQGLPILIAVDRAGFVGADGPTHHGLYDVSFCAAIPGIEVYSPGTSAELCEVTRKILEGNSGLRVIRYPRGIALCDPEWLAMRYSCDNYALFGDAAASTAIVTYGRLFFETGKLHKNLLICKLKRVIPIDPAAVASVMGCDRVFFFEEGVRSGGAGEHFALELLERGFAGAYRLLAVDGFARQASEEELLEEYGLNATAMEKLCEV